MGDPHFGIYWDHFISNREWIAIFLRKETVKWIPPLPMCLEWKHQMGIGGIEAGFEVFA